MQLLLHPRLLHATFAEQCARAHSVLAVETAALMTPRPSVCYPAGIGHALAFKCASQGMNVVLVAKPDNLLDETLSGLEAQYPELEFITVGVDLSNRDTAEEIADALASLPCPQVCFLNAGYILTGFFNQVPVEKHLANLECNVGHVLTLSHLLVNRCSRLLLSDCCRLLCCSVPPVQTGPHCSAAIACAVMIELHIDSFEAYRLPFQGLHPPSKMPW